jgi:glyoxylase-like metal-dependent hydrolase (beta-lactamase superfamily II)
VAGRSTDSAVEQPQLVDLMHLGRARVIGAWLLDDVIVDPGPSSCLPALLDALGGRRPRALALTHIHLDHAGASGTLARMFDDLEVWVHERGAPHMSDPARLLASAERLYGRDMQRLWGEFAAVPAERLRVLRGGETIDGFEVAYTPGHASHHVSYLHRSSGWAFTGDVAGVRIGTGPVMAPTPPPDIDLSAWRHSLDLLEAWQPRALAVTHFGVHRDPVAHLAAFRERLSDVEALAATLDADGFADAIGQRLTEGADAELVAAYSQATPPQQSYAGLRRHLERAGRGSPAGS